MKKTHYLMLSLLTTLPAVAANDFVAVIFNDVNSYSIKESTVAPSFIEVIKMFLFLVKQLNIMMMAD